mmetsp:Transcript_84430/g.131873  ORF Transcript_84430/g.131873 Transcript_84430/m.131873 type:complete len:201 (-) Transcript_84430:7-609(-)
MCSNKDCLASFEIWHDNFLPKWHHSSNGVFQALRVRNVFRIEISVLDFFARVVLAVLLKRWRRDVEAPAPNLDLVGTMLYHRLLLVEPSETSIHALIQAPRLGHRNMHLIATFQGEITSLDCSLKHRGIGSINLEATFFQKIACVLRLADAFFRKIYIDPSCENIRYVPLRLTMAGKDQSGVLRHGNPKRECAKTNKRSL